MDKRTQDRLFDVVVKLKPKRNPRELKKELKEYFDNLVEQGKSKFEAAKLTQEKMIILLG